MANPDSYNKNNVCGRVKHIHYNGIKFKGTWEVIVAKWLDENDIKYQYECHPFMYFWECKWHVYYPDFYLQDLDIFIEVKGYETKRDMAKWSFINNLIVFKENEIQQIKNIAR